MSLLFSSRDFECFHPEFRRSREVNQIRLAIKRKLASLGKMVHPFLKEAGASLEMRTSLHHPYIHNRFAVDSMWLYFSLSKKGYEPLQKILGDALGEDLHRHYNHTVLLLEIGFEGLSVALKIHPGAWWDGQNLKNKCRREKQDRALLELLRGLEGFTLRIHEWPNKHPCEKLELEKLNDCLRYYVPGEHWFHLEHFVPKENPLATGSDFPDFVKGKLLSLLPLHHFILWTPENNHVPQLNGKEKNV